MKILEQILDLVTAFSIRRWLSLLTILITTVAGLWLVDSYSAYSKLHRLDKSIALLERIDALEKRSLSPEVDTVRRTILAEVHSLYEAPSAQKVAIDEPKPHAGIPWHRQRWVKFASGAAPWLLISLIALIAARGDKNAWMGFFAIQLFTLLFGFVNYWIPSYGKAWIDHILLPLGVLFVCIVIPMSLAAVVSFRKVRDSSIRNKIINNLRQLSAAANLFYLESGRSEASYDELVGLEPNKYTRPLQPADGERYDLIEFKQGKPLVVFRRSGEPVSYEY